MDINDIIIEETKTTKASSTQEPRIEYKGRVYGDLTKTKVPTHDDYYRIETEPRLNRAVIYENNIKDIITEIETGIHPSSPSVYDEEGNEISRVPSFILEDGQGTKYEIVNDDDSVLVEELDSDGIMAVATRRYSKEMLAKLIYTKHFGFNVAGLRNVMKYGPEIYALEINKLWV